MAKKKFLFKKASAKEAGDGGYDPCSIATAVVNFELLNVNVPYDVKAKLTIVPPKEAPKPGSKPKKPEYRLVFTMPPAKKS